MWLTCRRQHDFSRPVLRIPRIYPFLRVFLSPLSSLVSTRLFARFPKYDHSEMQRKSNRLFLLRELKKITHITINVPLVKLFTGKILFLSVSLKIFLLSFRSIELFISLSSDTIDIIKISPVFEETFKSNFLDLSSRNGKKKTRKKRKRRRRRRRKRKKRSRTVSRPGDKRSAINSGDSVEERITRRTS